MAPIVIKHVVSFTSEDPENSVINLCHGDGEKKPWLCSRLDRSELLKAELQLERAAMIGYIDVGNFGSAFIQVDVGRSSWPLDHPYASLLPAATLMSPSDCRCGTGKHTVRMFKKADFLSESATESWDRLRITCSQPFNKRRQFGLSFLCLRTADEHSENDTSSQENKSTKDENTPDQMAEWISSPAVQNTFFGRNAAECSAEKNKRDFAKLNWAQRMVKAAHSAKPCQPAVFNTNVTNSEKSREETLDTQRGKTETHQKFKRKSETRRLQDRMTLVPKRSKSTDLTVQNKISLTPIRTSKQNENNTTAAASSRNSDVTDLPETLCPICGVSFSPDYLPLHASSCLDSGFHFSENVTASLSSYPPSGLVSCPLCSISFPTDSIEQHASTCGDTVWVD